MNFKGRYSAEGWLYFLRTGNSSEICSSLDRLHESCKHRLTDGMFGRWLTDNGKPFLGQETKEVAEKLARDRGFSVPHVSNTLPVAERNWGVLERMMRSMHAAAANPDDPNDTGAPKVRACGRGPPTNRICCSITSLHVRSNRLCRRTSSQRATSNR